MRKGQMREPRRNLPLLATSGLRLFRASLRGLGISKASFCCVGPLIAIPSGVFQLLGCHPRSLSFTDTFAARVARFFPVHLSPYLGHSRRRFFPSQQQSTTQDGQECPSYREGDCIRVLTLPSVSGTRHPACHTTTGVPV